jgi:threonine/homoserine/homoserine lactone efflux protein
MGSWELLLSFLVAASVFAFIPGPGMIYVAAQTMARGRRAGWLATLGVSLGGMAHVAGAVLGLSALFGYVPELYAVLKIAGAAYLVWLGVTIIRTRATFGSPDVADAPSPAGKSAGKSARRAFVDSVIVEVLNPKTAIFFIAFLPQFVDPAGTLPVWLQLLVLGLAVNLMFALGDVVAVLGAGFILGAVKASERAQRLIRWAGGGLMVGLGARLALDRS